jgi:hypothetical protein
VAGGFTQAFVEIGHAHTLSNPSSPCNAITRPVRGASTVEGHVAGRLPA